MLDDLPEWMSDIELRTWWFVSKEVASIVVVYCADC